MKCFLFLLFCLAAYTYASADELILPENMIIEKNYKPGFGMSVGVVIIAQGNVVVMHQKASEGYSVKNNTSLYKNDTIFCLSNSRVSFRFNDGSILSLGSNTQMMITESIYDEANRKRASFIRMKTGKARFGVTKLSNYQQSDFKVKTPTAIIGVRGSDFIIRAKKLFTEVVTFQDTVLEVVNLFVPDVMPVFLSDFEKVVVEAEMLTSVVTPISEEEAEEFKQEFIFDDQTIITAVHDNHEVSSETKVENMDQSDGIVTPPEVIQISEDEIVTPIDEEPIQDDIVLVTSDDTIESTVDLNTEISEDIHESNMKNEMPDLPDHPIR